MTSQIEASKEDKRRGMGDAWGGRRTGVSGNSVGEDLYMDTPVNRDSVVGGTAQYFSIFGKNPISKNLEIGPTIFDI